jgi:hypothetical protein
MTSDFTCEMICEFWDKQVIFKIIWSGPYSCITFQVWEQNYYPINESPIIPRILHLSTKERLMFYIFVVKIIYMFKYSLRFSSIHYIAPHFWASMTFS